MFRLGLTVTAAAWWLILRSSPQSVQLADKHIYIPSGKRGTITLLDGSVVHLNAKSRLRFPGAFVGSTRAVFLEGEAFFEVI